MTAADLWKRQLAAILRIEFRKTLISKRAWWVYLLALGPVILTAGHSLIESRRANPGCTIGEDSMVFAGIFQLFYLRLGIFFGCLGIFANLFRGEMLEKTLHYYLLSPVRRDVLLAAKYTAGLVASMTLFGVSVALGFLTISAHFGQEYRGFLLNGPGLHQLGWYLVVTLLACAGYGAVFVLFGLVFRNPMIPSAAVLVWEGINGFLPSLLKKFSVIFYLKSLSPVEVPITGPFALIAIATEPTPAWLAIPGLILVAALILVYASLRVKRLEINYGE